MPRTVPKWEIFHAYLAGAIQRHLGADDVGQRQVVDVGGDVVDALFVKGDADDVACGRNSGQVAVVATAAVAQTRAGAVEGYERHDDHVESFGGHDRKRLLSMSVAAKARVGWAINGAADASSAATALMHMRWPQAAASVAESMHG